MQKLFPNREPPIYDKSYYLKLIKQREEIITLCTINNQKRRNNKKTKQKKEMTLHEKIISLKGQELKDFLISEGFKLNN